MPNKARPTRSTALAGMLACTLLSSCGTCFHRLPYNVGVKHPYVEGKHFVNRARTITPKSEFQLEKCRIADLREPCDITHADLYRIGHDYYVKVEAVYTPVTMYSFKWDILTPPKNFPIDKPGRQEKATCYLRVADPSSLEAGRMPQLARPQGEPTGADILTEEQAAALNPVFVKPVDKVLAWRACASSAKQLQPRYSWTHYAMLPATAATFVVVDLPCDIIGSLGALIVYGGLSLFE